MCIRGFFDLPSAGLTLAVSQQDGITQEQFMCIGFYLNSEVFAGQQLEIYFVL
jgi:hypothetical protein